MLIEYLLFKMITHTIHIANYIISVSIYVKMVLNTTSLSNSDSLDYARGMLSHADSPYYMISFIVIFSCMACCGLCIDRLLLTVLSLEAKPNEGCHPTKSPTLRKSSRT